MADQPPELARSLLHVEALAEKAAMSVSPFHRQFTATTSLSPMQCQKRIRLMHARTLMVAGAWRGAAAYDVGYERRQARSARRYIADGVAKKLGISQHIS